MRNIETLFSHKSDEWATPQKFFDELDNEFDFDLDVAADENNHKCEKYYTMKDDGLTQNWGGIGYFAIRHIVKLLNGLKRHFMKQSKIILWS